MSGEHLWTSEKINKLPEELAYIYAWLHPLALDDGSFEAEPQLIWQKCFAYRGKKSVAEVAAILDRYEEDGLLFRWIDVGGKPKRYKLDAAGGHPGKIWGFWTNVDKKGRLPAPSDRKKFGPGVPATWLRQYMARKKKVTQLTLGARRQAAPRSDLGAASPGLGLDLEREKGVGVGLAARKKSEPGSAPQESSPTAPPPAVRNREEENSKKKEPGTMRFDDAPQLDSTLLDEAGLKKK